MTEDKPTLDQVTRDALQLSFSDLERLIGRLTAEHERRITNSKLREGRALGREMAARLHVTNRQISPKEKK